MGFGLMGAGAAVSGMVEGYQKGRKFAMEEEEAEERKKVRGLQMKKAEQDLRKGELDLEESNLRLGAAKQDLSIDDEIRAARNDAEAALRGINSAASKPSLPPGATITASSPEGADIPVQPGGIAAPGGGLEAQGGSAATPKSAWEIRRRMEERILNAELGRRGANRGEILSRLLKNNRTYKMAETQETIDYMARFASGESQENLFAEMAAKGMAPAPGTTMRIVDTPLYQGSKQTFKDVEIVLPDNRVLRRSDMQDLVLSPEQALDHRTKVGKLMADVSHHAAMQTIAQESSAERTAQSNRQHRETMARIDAQMKQQAELYKLNFDKFKWDKFTATQADAMKQLERLFQYSPLTESERLKIEKMDEDAPILDKDGKVDPTRSRLAVAMDRVDKASRAVSGAMIIYGMNIDPVTLKPSATPGEVRSAVDVLLKAREKPELIKRDDLNRSYVVVGSNKVYVPSADNPEPDKTRGEGARGATGTPPPAPGVRPPAGATPTASSKASEISDQQILDAVKQNGIAGYQSALLGQRPGIRNQSGVSSWDADAKILSARFDALLRQQRAQSR